MLVAARGLGSSAAVAADMATKAAEHQIFKRLISSSYED